MADDPRHSNPQPDDFPPQWDGEPEAPDDFAEASALEEGLYEPPDAIIDDETLADRRPPSLPGGFLGVVVLAAAVIIIVLLILRGCGPAAGPEDEPGAGVVATEEAGGTLQPTFTPTPITSPTAQPEPTATAEPPTATPQPVTTLREGMYVTVSGTGEAGLRFRTGPGMNYITSEILAEGTRLLVVGGPEQADGVTWWRLQTEDGAIGWAAEDLLTPEAG